MVFFVVSSSEFVKTGLCHKSYPGSLTNLKNIYFAEHLWTTSFKFITILTLALSFELGGEESQCALGTSHESVQLSLAEEKKFGDNLQLEYVYASTPNATILVWLFNNRLLSILNGTNITDFELNISGNNVLLLWSLTLFRKGKGNGKLCT